MADAEPGSIAHPRFAAVLVAVALVLAAARILAVFTENVNWDEFALLQRAVTTARTGDLVGGGRPGLGTLILVPFARECRNAVDALVQARILWTAMVFGSAVCLWYLLRGVLRPSSYRWIAVATGVGLWVLSTPFLRSSIEVRTDQPAILFGLLGGLALLASRRRMAWALVAGALLGIGFLFTQKLLYVGGLLAVLAAGQLAIRGDWRSRREVLRVVLTGVAFLVVVVAYRELMGRISAAPNLVPLAGGMRAFEQYHEYVGWTYYRQMVPRLLPHGLAVLCLVLLTVDMLRRGGRYSAEVVTAWGAVAVGVVVMFFHAARFPYFLMVLGLFPAAVGCLIVVPVLERLRTPGQRIFFLALVWFPLAGLGTVFSATLTLPTLQHQRASLDFVERNFSPDARGFEGRGAFGCRSDPDPFPVRFYGRVRREFAGDERMQRIHEMAEEFRSRPVAFMILPVAHGYPPELWAFWGERYVHYHSAVHVPGRVVMGEAGWSERFEVLVPGQYMWRTEGGATEPLEVNGNRVQPGTGVLLEKRGYLQLRLPQGGKGLFVLSLADPPAPDTTPFYAGL